MFLKDGRAVNKRMEQGSWLAGWLAGWLTACRLEFRGESCIRGYNVGVVNIVSCNEIFPFSHVFSLYL